MPLRLSKAQWRTLIYWFVRGAPSAQIAHETGLERKRVLRALAVVREAMRRANPDLARGSRVSAISRPAALPRTRNARLGLYVWNGLVGVDLAEGNADAWTRQGYVAVVQRGRLQRVPEQGPTRTPFGHIEAFWSYLQRNLRAKGGIRPGRLNLYLAEFVWRYNNRKLTNSEQADTVFRLVSVSGRWNERDYAVLVNASDVGGRSLLSRPR